MGLFECRCASKIFLFVFRSNVKRVSRKCRVVKILVKLTGMAKLKDFNGTLVVEVLGKRYDDVRQHILKDMLKQFEK